MNQVNTAEKKKSNSYTLVLTSCIDPVASSNGKKPVKRSNSSLRLQDYLKALEFWLCHQDSRIKKIIFIDNSGYSLEKLDRLAQEKNIWNRRCEFISMNNNELIEGLSYGYSEFKLIDQGLAKSNIIESEDYIIKSTGRYIFPDISKLLDRLPDRFLFAGDSVDFYSVGLRNSKLVNYRSSRTKVALLISEFKFYNLEIRNIYKELVPFDWKEKAFVETLLFKKIHSINNNKNIILRFPCNCDPLGIGGNNTNYSSQRQKIVRLARKLGRIIVPKFWF